MILWKKVSMITTCILITSLIAAEIQKDTVEVTLQQGQTYSIELPSNSSTGYSWNMLSGQPANKRMLELVKIESASQQEKGKIGGSKMQKFTFKAIKPTGTSRVGVYLYYCRPWSGEIAKIKQLSVLINTPEQK